MKFLVELYSKSLYSTFEKLVNMLAIEHHLHIKTLKSLQVTKWLWFSLLRNYRTYHKQNPHITTIIYTKYHNIVRGGYNTIAKSSTFTDSCCFGWRGNKVPVFCTCLVLILGTRVRASCRLMERRGCVLEAFKWDTRQTESTPRSNCGRKHWTIRW